MAFLTITLNPAVDLTYIQDEFRLGEINRVGKIVSSPGGKGNNVARVLAGFGYDVSASGFIAGRNGKFIEESLAASAVRTAFVEVTGESRRCIALLELRTGRVSEFLEPGPTVSRLDGEKFLATAKQLARGVEWVIVSGSLPDGLEPDYYADLLESLRGVPASVAFDSSGEWLRIGLASRPQLIKPNEAELEELMGATASIEETVQRVQEQLLTGPLVDMQVLLSLGARGAMLISAGTALRAVPPPVAVKNPVGAGDALLAGFLDARTRRLSDPDALSWAVAVAAAAVLEETAGRVNIGAAQHLIKTVEREWVQDQRPHHGREESR